MPRMGHDLPASNTPAVAAGEERASWVRDTAWPRMVSPAMPSQRGHRLHTQRVHKHEALLLRVRDIAGNP